MSRPRTVNERLAAIEARLDALAAQQSLLMKWAIGTGAVGGGAAVTTLGAVLLFL